MVKKTDLNLFQLTKFDLINSFCYQIKNANNIIAANKAWVLFVN